MITEVSYDWRPMCEILIGVRMGHSNDRHLESSRDGHSYSEHLDETHVDVLHTPRVHSIRNQFWQFPLCNQYQLWQPDELHQLLLGLVKDLLHWLLIYLKASNVKDQFDARFTSVPEYPGLQHFSTPFDSMKSSYWQGKQIWGMIRTLDVNATPSRECSNDDGKTLADSASDQIVLGAVWALCEFSLLVSQQNHCGISLTALDNAMKWF